MSKPFTKLLAALILATLVPMAWVMLRPPAVPPPARHSAPAPGNPAATATALRESPSVPEPVPAPPRPPTLAEALLLPHGLERRHALERLAAEAAQDPAAALEQLQHLAEAPDQRAFARALFERLAALPPAQVMEWVKGLKEPAREEALLTLARGWLGREIGLPDLASHRGYTLALGFAFLSSGAPRPEIAALWAKELLSGPARLDLLGAAAYQMAGTDPDRAYALADGLDEKERRMVYLKVAAGWALKDPEAAWAWALKTGDPSVRSELQGSVIRNWAATDPRTAAARLNDLPPGPIREETAGMVAYAWAEKDTAAALDWINSLPESREKELAQKRLKEVAPVGIGVVLQMGDDGLPSITGLVPDGPASLQGGVGPQDKIVGIVNDNGEIMDLRGADLSKITGLIRGNPGTTIRLRILPANESTPSAARTIELIRGQIMHKRSPG